MHLQAMGPVQALLPIYFTSLNPIAVAVRAWQWTMNSTRTCALKMYSWQHIVNASICEVLWRCYHHYGTIKWLTEVRRLLSPYMVHFLSGVSLTSVKSSCIHHNTLALSPALLGQWPRYGYSKIAVSKVYSWLACGQHQAISVSRIPVAVTTHILTEILFDYMRRRGMSSIPGNGEFDAVRVNNCAIVLKKNRQTFCSLFFPQANFEQ